MSSRLYLDIFGYYLPAVVGILCFLFGLALLLSSLEKYRDVRRVPHQSATADLFRGGADGGFDDYRPANQRPGN